MFKRALPLTDMECVQRVSEAISELFADTVAVWSCIRERSLWPKAMKVFVTVCFTKVTLRLIVTFRSLVFLTFKR